MDLQGSVKVFRRPEVADPYTRGDPGATVPGSWAAATSWELEGAAVLQSSAVALRGDDRVGSVAMLSLYVDNAAADLRKGDGVARSMAAERPEFVLEVVPFANTNPFTGWTPVLEVPLKEVTG